ncbi:hypothetical protein Dsin_021369 [Dipteronia sinensis]|uniref:NAC domain-containing protein n=1 Tax=Dipteronia sinensis TaxID=43782 RepID=A0AAE0A029_9ROSI|nr:hypothetical protein Dsin_021369 [Dipteronia sinensis]
MEEATNMNNKVEELIDLPPGFRFHPTDEEIITYYLTQKVMNSSFDACAVGEVDLNKCEPWDLPKKAKMGEKEWYFFCNRDRKYPTGMRTNRATEAGYWKATGKDKEIFKGKNCLVGMKKTLVFYTGRAPKGEKTNWVMHEYRLEGKFSYYNLPAKASKEEWVVCRVFHKSTGMKKNPGSEFVRIEDDFFDYSTLPPLMDTPASNYSNRPSSSYSSAAAADGDNQFDFKHINNNNYQPTNINNNNFLVQPSSNFQPQIPVLQNNPLFSGGYQTRGPNNNPAGYLHQGIMRSSSIDQAILQLQAAAAAAANNNNNKWDHIGQQQQCKVEQFSSNNQSMISQSQDTGLSSDMNTTEISSKQVVNNNNNNNMGGGSSNDTINIDLDNFWENF